MSQGRAERAARLLGAGQAPITAAGSLTIRKDQAEYNQAVATARAQLGEEAFAAAWQAGQAMSLDEAIDYALADPTGSCHSDVPTKT